MTLKKQIIVDVEMTSSASEESALHQHLNEFCSMVVQYTREQSDKSWWANLNTSCGNKTSTVMIETKEVKT